MPSKLLIVADEAAHDLSRSEQFGVRAENIQVDGKAVLERVRKEPDRFVGFVGEDTETLPEANRLRGHARFVGPTTLSVAGTGANGASADEEVRVEAGSNVLATGSSPIIPEPLSAVRDRVLTNDSIFELEDLHESVAVIGTGVIGLELAQALQRLGSRVVLFGRSGRLGPLTDPAVQEAAQNSTRARPCSP
jgi:dihydrolipoamide dehydrogenase